MKFRHLLIGFALLGGVVLSWTTEGPHVAAEPSDTIEHTHAAIQHRAAASVTPEKKPARAPSSDTLKKPKPQIGRQVAYTPPPIPDLSGLKLPQTETGGIMLFPVDTGANEGHLEIQEDLRDPLTTVGGCTRWIVSCVKPGERSLDDCARSAPHCTTDKPWEEEAHCCPTSCFDSYATLRTGGIEPIPAFNAVYFESGACFPGLNDLLSGASPAPTTSTN